MKHILTPLILIALAVLIFLSNINIPLAREIVTHWWPTGLVLLAVWMYASNPRNMGWPILLGAIGLALQVNTLGLANISVGDFVIPGILLAIALGMLTKFKTNQPKSVKESSHETTAIMSGIDYNNASDDYTGGNVTAILGGVNVDLRKAKIKKSATVNMSVVMGGVELWVPEDVEVVPKATCIMGGIENKGNPKSDKTLYIAGEVIMGGIEIKR